MKVPFFVGNSIIEGQRDMMKKVILSIKRFVVKSDYPSVSSDAYPEFLGRRLSPVRLVRGCVGREHLGDGLRRLQGRNQAERNIWYLYVEMFWAAIFMAAMAFNATYALRLGASNALFGWMSSFPALLAMLMMIPAARFLETKSDRAPWMKWSLLLGRSPFLLIALVPWIFKQHQAEIIVAILILRAIPMNFFSAGFSPMMADLIPVRDRAQVMANRSIIHSATVAVCTFLYGQWMDAAANLPWATFPAELPNRLPRRRCGGAAEHVLREQAPCAGDQSHPAATATQETEAFTAQVSKRRSTLRMVPRKPRFRAYRGEHAVFNLGAWLVMSLYTIFFVKELQATDGWIGLNTTLANIGVILGHVIWQRVIRKLGYDRSLLVAIIPSASYAFLVALFPNLTLILLWGVLINLVNPGVNLTHYNILVQLCPEERRASYMALFSSIMNAGAFLAPMVGVALAEVIDIRWVLIIGGVIRLFGAIDVPLLESNRER